MKNSISILNTIAPKELSTQLSSTINKLNYYLSSSVLNGDLESIPELFKEHGRAVHPFNLPRDQQSRFLRVSAWLKSNKVPLTNRRLQGQTYYACMLLNSGLAHIKQYFYREYLLDILDHADKMAAYSGNYPHLSFGPEQRFLAKGAYIIDLDTEETNWIIPGL